MSLTDYVIMPGADYQAICDAIREKTETTEPIKSGDAAGMIQAFQGGGEVIKAMCENETYDLTGDNVEFVCDHAFNSEYRLKSVSLKNAKTVGRSAFDNCDNLETVSLPAVTSIGIFAFNNCDNLKTLEIPNVVTIEQQAFKACGLPNINAPNVNTVGYGAFRESKLETASFPKARLFQDSAFYNCGSLKSVSMPLAMEAYPRIFQHCSNLEHTDILQAISRVGAYWFSGCSKLVTLPCLYMNNVGMYAFENCTSLQGFTYSETQGTSAPTGIGEGAFLGCEALTDEAVKILTSWLSVIEPYVFYSCKSITKVDLPMATEIKAAAFQFCSNLTAVILRHNATLCVMDFSAFYETPLFNLQGYIYVPSAMYEPYRAVYSDALDAAYAEIGVTIDGGIFNVMFRKIEDYPEICG